MQIEVSIGEVVDKWTILSIKALNITDKDKLKNVFVEKNYLNTVIDPEILHDPLVDDLLKTNKALWDVDDLLRDGSARTRRRNSAPKACACCELPRYIST